MSGMSEILHALTFYFGDVLIFRWCPYLSLNRLTTHCGMFGVFHSLFEFISLFLGVFSISSPSIICRFVGSLWKVRVTSILKFTRLPSCTVMQWLSSIESLLLLLYFWRCSDPWVYALYEDSPWYKSFCRHSSVQDIK